MVCVVSVLLVATKQDTREREGLLVTTKQDTRESLTNQLKRQVYFKNLIDSYQLDDTNLEIDVDDIDITVNHDNSTTIDSNNQQNTEVNFFSKN